MSKFLGSWLAAICLLSLSGCGSKKATGNVVNVTLFSSVGNTIILGQSATLTANVTGATNTKVTWPNIPCQYTTTTVSGTTSTTSKPIACPTDGSFGTLTNTQDTGTATYTAPNTIPDQTKFPGLVLIFTAQSQQDTTKTGTFKMALDSGISVVLNLTSATVPTNEQQTFFVTLTNDLQTKHVTWLVTQGTPTSTIPYPSLTSCSPGCGTVTAQANNLNIATYTAPATVPTGTTVTKTPANVILVATSVSDNTRFALAGITIVAGGPITFNGISPTIAPQGAAFWDIYLDAPNISSASKITLNIQDSNNPTTFIGSKTFDSTSGQIKVLFPIPTSTTTNPTSTGARLRLRASDLVIPPATGTVTVYVSVTDPGEPVTPLPPTQPVPLPNPYTFQILPVRPVTTASFPDDVVQGSTAQNTRVIIDGGYFGPPDSPGPIVDVYLQSPGNIVGQDAAHPSTARQLDTFLSTSQINAGSPGLYPLYVSSNATVKPTPISPSVTNIAVFPDFQSNPPALLPSPTPAGLNPSAMDIDPTLGILAVAETESNKVEFFSIGKGSLTLLPCPVASCAVNLPTGLSINRTNHTVAVVSYLDQTIQVFPLPGTTAPAGVPFTTPVLPNNLLGAVTPAPIPYSIGVDSDTNLALVAFSSTSITSASNLGFVVNLNTGSNPPFGCLDPTNTTGPCIFSQVTLNTGSYPQVAMAPHGHLALVSPGGSGIARGVDVTKRSTSTPILSATLTAGQVTITTTKDHGLIPGNAGTVLVAGVCSPTFKCPNGTNFNGVFSVTVSSNTTFTYTLNPNSNSNVSDSGTGGTVFYGTPNLVFPLSSTAQGIAINPITNVAALADANSTGRNGPQIDLLNGLDQSTSSITFLATCTAYTTSCAGSAELLSTARVAWQPFTNALVSYNPQQKLVSISDPVSRGRYAIVPVLGAGGAQIDVTNGTTGKLTLWGAVSVDPATNQAFVLESGVTPTPPATGTPGQIEIIDLGPASGAPIKPTHISEVLVPSPTAGTGNIGGIPNALVPQATLACIAKPPALPSTCDLAGVKIFGSGFNGSSQVHLDGTDIASNGGVVSYIASSGGREIDVTIPSIFLSAPHHYALDVLSSGAQSNVADFIVIQAVDLSQVCPGTNAQPSSVAIADQIANGPFSPIALVSVSGCNDVVLIDLNPANATFGGVIGSPIGVGTTPQGIAIYQRHGLAVVTNNGSNNATIIDLKATPPVPLASGLSPVNTGTSPAGVAVNEATGAAIVANTGSNTISLINLGLLFPPTGTPPTTLTPITIGGIQQPLAVAIDPDRGTNFQGIAVVSALSLSNGSAASGALAVVDIGLTTPALSNIIPSGFVNAAPTGIVFDPIARTGTAHSGLFFANSSGTNTISTFNPDNGFSNPISVGINPTSLAVNPQTGAILTSNTASNTVSIVDTLGSPLKTVQTLGLPGSQTFGVAIDQFTNLAVIVDQAHQRVLLFPMPH